MVRIIKKFYQFLWKYKWLFAAALLMTVVAAAIESLTPYFYKLLIEDVQKGEYGGVTTLLLLYVGSRLGGNWLGVTAYWLSDRVLLPAARDARMKVFGKIQDLDFAYHVEKNTGSLISAFKRGDSAFFDVYQALHSEILEVVVHLGVTLFFFSFISGEIILIMLVVFGINFAITWVLTKENIKRRRDFNDAEDDVSGIITDNLLNYETVKFFAQEKKEGERLSFSFVNWLKKLWRFTNSFRLMALSLGTVSSLGIFFMLWLVLQKLERGEIGIGDFVMVASFLGGFYYQFFGLMHQIRRIARHFVDLQKYLSILDNKIKVKDPKRPKTIDNFKGKIEFRKVSFTYPRNRRKIVKNINLLIKPGESVAFVGRSGAGKTTLVKLLLRFYDTREGEILVDGVKISQMAKSYWRKFVGVVPQEPILFNNTIAFNIGYGVKKASLARIKQAAEEASLREFIESLPKKYETQVGERGVKLSGGQKQRMAIARAFLANPKIVVFDEATSNLDSESEESVQKALWNIAKKRTVLIIAHRFSTIRRVDKIVVLEKGEIVEVGNHQELMKKKGGVYKKLWQLQVKGKLDKDEGGLLNPG